MLGYSCARESHIYVHPNLEQEVRYCIILEKWQNYWCFDENYCVCA